MKEYTSKYIKDIINELLSINALERKEGTYSMLKLNRKSIGILKGEEKVLLEVNNNEESYLFGRPVFILGTAQRSGTNYLKNMICLHPDCFCPGPVWEDFLLLESNYLIGYVNATFSRWNPSWEVGGFLEGKSSLLGAIGNGLLEYLHQQFYSEIAKTNEIDESIKDKYKRLRLITKTPSVQNIDEFFKLFPFTSYRF